MAVRGFIAFSAVILQLCSCRATSELLPEFLAPLENHTVIQGRDVSFTCTVNHLQSYKVAWIKSDSRAILAIHTHMVAHNPRLSVTHNGHNTWKLHVSNVQKNDSGTYMCQVNTDPMRSQMGWMNVVIPPDIMNDESANGLVTAEGGNVRLKCVTTGSPKPTVTWKREDGRNIILRVDGQKQSLKSYEGEILELIGVQRQEMGAYLCIASNNVPPTVSKRYAVNVHFVPVIKVPNQLVAAPINSDVVLQCVGEASPHAMNTWHREKGEKLLHGDRYVISEYPLSEYSWQLNFTIKSLDKKDFGGYVCSSENALGKANGTVRLQELHLSTLTTPSTFGKNTDPKIRNQKPNNNRKKGKGNTDRRPYNANNLEDMFDNDAGNNQDVKTTQIMTGSTSYDGQQRTDKPFLLPSLSPPWVIMNAASCKETFLFSTVNLIFLFSFPITISF